MTRDYHETGSGKQVFFRRANASTPGPGSARRQLALRTKVPRKLFFEAPTCGSFTKLPVHAYSIGSGDLRLERGQA